MDATSQKEWDRRWLEDALHNAQRSKDPSTKVGCVVVGEDQTMIAQGWNGFPRGVPDDPALLADRESRLRLTIHAEKNAFLNAARLGVRLKGATLYVTAPPCAQCAAAAIQVGIARIVHLPPTPAFAERWAKDMQAAAWLLDATRTSVLERNLDF